MISLEMIHHEVENIWGILQKSAREEMVQVFSEEINKKINGKLYISFQNIDS